MTCDLLGNFHPRDRPDVWTGRSGVSFLMGHKASWPSVADASVGASVQ